MNIKMIKNKINLNTTALSDLIASIKSAEMDDNQRKVNLMNSYSTQGVATGSAFAAFPSNSTAPQPPMSYTTSPYHTITHHATSTYVDPS